MGATSWRPRRPISCVAETLPILVQLATDSSRSGTSSRRPTGSGFVGEVIFRDAFGNLITNINADHLGNSPRGEWEIEIAGERITGILRTYGERPAGSLVALVGSAGWVEVAVVNGDAARQLTAGRWHNGVVPAAWLSSGGRGLAGGMGLILER